ncbi:MAG: glycosyltransferase family 4 protein [Clostridiales bacterium]|jgi:glycosyltransferase involved in cell wall biosynthesis|nr:glycosyltransferase family 4 protein [Clostridiales bacterium]
MKIAMIGHKRAPSRSGGVEVVVEELAVRMARMGHELRLYNRGVCPNSGNLYKGVHIIDVPAFLSGGAAICAHMFLATFKALADGCDVLHYHAEGSCAALLVSHAFKAKTVVTIHGLDWRRAKWRGLARAYLRFCEFVGAKLADDIITLSQSAQTYFLEKYGRETLRIPNGANQPTIRPARLIRQKFGLEKNGYILFLARITPEKGLHYLLDAYAELSIHIPLVIAGAYECPKYKRVIENRVQNTRNVIMTGFVENETLAELLTNAFLYVLPSDTEGAPISLLEAMSYGKRCLVSDIPEHMEMITDDGGTLLASVFKRGDRQSLKRELEKIINEDFPMFDARLSEYVLSRYSWRTVVEEIIAVYSGSERVVTDDISAEISNESLVG